MSGFQHDIAGGGGNLIVTSLQSPNFVTGETGWQIAKDGSAEFNDLEIRGTFFGSDFIIDPDGMFFYAGTPANGNLIMALAVDGGFDQFGNEYTEGLSFSGAGQTEIQIRPDLNALLIYG